MTKYFLNGFLFVCIALGGVGCKSTSSKSSAPTSANAPMGSGDAYVDEFADEEMASAYDPFEGVNRRTFVFNNWVFNNVYGPFAKGYTTVTPEPVRTGITNFFHNLRFPSRFVNQVLQGKFENSARETGKFLFNSTLGIAGLVKCSDNIPELNPPGEDLGQTLGYWGIGNGPYLIVPFLGPITTRDLVGRVGDRYLDPVNYAPEWEIEWSATIIENINETPASVGLYNLMTQSALDKYSAVKDGYVQFRANQVKQ